MIPKVDVHMPEGVLNKVLKGVAVVALFFVAKKFFLKQAGESADSQIATDPAAGQARALNAAMNPSGISFLREMDTTDTKAIYDIAANITDLAKVQEYYKAQTGGRALHEDLTKELTPAGYDKFLAIATKGKTGNPKFATVRGDILPNRWVITKADANIRKTPKVESRLMPGNNILKLVKNGRTVGVTTGKFAYDEPNDTTFIEFYTLGAKTAGKAFFYVAMSQVELITNEEKKKRDKAFKIPFEVLAGIEGSAAAPALQIVSKRPTMVLGEDFKPLALVPAGMIVGFALMTLNTGKGQFTKVQTIEGKTRWVKSEDVSVQNRD